MDHIFFTTFGTVMENRQPKVNRCSVIGFTSRCACWRVVAATFAGIFLLVCYLSTWLVKRFASELSPFIAALFNASFRDGLFPSTLIMSCVSQVTMATGCWLLLLLLMMMIMMTMKTVVAVVEGKAINTQQ